jgi:hypothetical protein
MDRQARSLLSVNVGAARCELAELVESYRQRCGGAKLGEFEQGLDAVVLEFLVAALESRVLAQDGWRRRAAL